MARVLDCSVCGQPVRNISAKRYKWLVVNGVLPTHRKCGRLSERRGACKRRRTARITKPIAVPGVAGVSMQWQTNWQQCKGGPLAKAIVSQSVLPTYDGRGAAGKRTEE